MTNSPYARDLTPRTFEQALQDAREAAERKAAERKVK